MLFIGYVRYRPELSASPKLGLRHGLLVGWYNPAGLLISNEREREPQKMLFWRGVAWAHISEKACIVVTHQPHYAKNVVFVPYRASGGFRAMI